jgi:SnoaL-like domain
MSGARLQELLDRADILDCLTRFCRGMDRFDRDLYLSAFHDDAEMAAGPYVGDVPGCWDWAMPMHRDGQVLTHHLLLNNSVEIDGDTAHSETYYQFVARNHPWEEGGGETVMLAGGRYIDRLERRDGHWNAAALCRCAGDWRQWCFGARHKRSQLPAAVAKCTKGACAGVMPTGWHADYFARASIGLR